MELPEFIPFRKIPRWERDIIITEKIDGTNGIIHIADDFTTIIAGSRTRWITPEDDNHGFARWVHANAASLIADLGPGLHYGEWWGQGIQRRYGLTEKRFSLFNVTHWRGFVDRFTTPGLGIVPILYEGPLDLDSIETCLRTLEIGGSQAALGFPKPEGIVIFHTASSHLYKKTLGDDGAKGIVKPAETPEG